MDTLLTSVLILNVICSVTLADPGIHTLRIRFPGPNSDKIVLPRPVKQELAPYPSAGFKPKPPFELPEQTYLPPQETELAYGPPKEVYGPPADPEMSYGPPETELTYGPPSDTYGTPDGNTYEPQTIIDFQSAAVVNAPLTLAMQFLPPRPNKAVNFRPLRPQSTTIVNAPLKPVSHLTAPRPQSSVAFRPRRPTVASELYPKTYLTLPRIERLIQFRPQRVPNQQQSNFFSRPLPSSIIGNSKNDHFRRQLPSKIFSN